MLNVKLKIIVILLFIFQLLGCGLDEDAQQSSSEDDAVESTVNDFTLASNESEILTNEEEQILIKNAKDEMDLLVADSAFNFTNKQQVDVALDLISDLNLTGQIDQRAYVSIYRDYQLLDSGVFHPDSSSRVISGDLKSGIFNHSFISLKNQSSYLVEIWFYNGELPIQREIEIINNNLSW